MGNYIVRRTNTDVRRIGYATYLSAYNVRVNTLSSHSIINITGYQLFSVIKHTRPCSSCDGNVEGQYGVNTGSMRGYGRVISVPVRGNNEWCHNTIRVISGSERGDI